MEIYFSSTVKLRVRYGETDQMGYCYYGNYAQYFEVGRVETLREIGMSYKDMERDGVMLPVSDFEVKYYKPALYDDEIKIITKLTKLEGCRVTFEYEIENSENERISTAKTTLVFVSKTTMKPTPPPTSFLNLLKTYEK
jgi:acyl-CoA thioester hydrolase